MRYYRGSFTVETAFVFSVVLCCICVVIETGISLRQEVKIEAEYQKEKEAIDVIAAMYRKDFAEEFWENRDEN